MRWVPLVVIAFLAGCAATTEQPGPSKPAPQAAAQKVPPVPTQAQKQQFFSVVRAVEPVAERECRKRAPSRNCDFKIVVDERKGQPANAFQSLDKSGRPVLTFNLALIASVRNRDELAFVVGHEAAHHIAGHIARQQQSASAGAILLGGIAAIAGAGSSGIQAAQNVGAVVGARTYSKEFELEADALGTVITRRAGFNPVKGAAFFSQLPDPGNRFLGTHPPHKDRIETIKRVNAGL